MNCANTNQYVTIAVNRNLSNCKIAQKKAFPLKPRKTFFRLFYNCLNCNSLRWSPTHSFVFPQFTSFHSVFRSFCGLMNSINWPASSVWVLTAQLVEHCSANAETTDPVEALKTFFQTILQLLKLRFTAMVTYSFH